MDSSLVMAALGSKTLVSITLITALFGGQSAAGIILSGVMISAAIIRFLFFPHASDQER